MRKFKTFVAFLILVLIVFLLASCEEQEVIEPEVCFSCRIVSATYTPSNVYPTNIYVDRTYKECIEASKVSEYKLTTYVTREIGWTKKTCFKIVKE